MAQALGGLFKYCKAANQPIVIEDEESAFLFHLVNRCKGEVLEITYNHEGFRGLLSAICLRGQ
jgi:hypothetical protein